MKFRSTLIFIFVFYSITASSQTIDPSTHVQVYAGGGFHSTGDMKGFVFGTEFSRHIKKRLTLSLFMGGTIHDGSIGIFYTDPGDVEKDGSIRYTTAGFQVGSHLGIDIIKPGDHNLQFKIGPLVRYQSSSYYDIAVILFPPGTNLPVPVSYYINNTPQRTFAIGGSTQLAYYYTFPTKFTVGSNAGFQMDTRGDIITNLSLSIGKRF